MDENVSAHSLLINLKNGFKNNCIEDIERSTKLLYARYARPFYQYAIHRDFPPEAADDVVGDTFEQILEGLDGYNVENLGVTEQSIRLWERGERLPTSSNRKALTHFLDIPPELLGLQNDTYIGRNEHIGKNEFQRTVMTMERSEAYTYQSEERRGDLYVYFNLCSLYIDWAEICMKLDGRGPERALDFIAKAEELEQSGHVSSRWSAPIRLLKGEVLVRMGMYYEDKRSYQVGMDLLIEGYKLAKKHQDKRLMQHAFNLVNKLARRSESNISKLELMRFVREFDRDSDFI